MKKTHTRLRDRENGRDEIIDQAIGAVKRWLRGEVDKVELIRTPQNEKIVDEYDRARNTSP